MAGALFTGEDVSINGIVLNRIDDSGCQWLLEDIEGWWSLPNPDIFDDPKTAYEDGSYIASGRYQPREITITGRITPPAGQSMPVVIARNTLNEALNLVRTTGLLQVLEQPNPKQAYVQISAAPLTTFDTEANQLVFSIPLRAADPRKFSIEEYVKSLPAATKSTGRLYERTFPQSYGITTGHNGVTTVINNGNYRTDAMLRIHGPIQDPKLKHTHAGVSSTLYFDVDIKQDDYLDVDLQMKTAIFKGGRSGRTTLLPSSRWFSIEPGTNSIQYTGTTTLVAREYSPATTNLIKNPTLADTDTGGVVDGSSMSGPVSSTTTIDFLGPENRRRVVYTRTGTGAIELDYGNVSPYTAATAASTTYNISGYFKAAQDAQIKLQLAPSGTTGSGATSGVLSLTGGEWTRLSFSGATAAGQTSTALSVIWQAVEPGFTDVAGNTLEVSMLQMTPGADLYPYFDGDSQFSSWAGDPYKSASNQQELTAIPATVVELAYRDAWIY